MQTQISWIFDIDFFSDTDSTPKPTLYYLCDRQIHRTRKPPHCKYCSLCFSGISHYLSHLRRHESNIKPYWYKDRNLPPKAGAKQTRRHWHRTRAEIGKHNKSKTIKNASKKQVQGSSQPNEQKCMLENCYPCSYCGQKFTFPSSDLYSAEHNVCRPDGKLPNFYICKSCFLSPRGYEATRTEISYRGEQSFSCRYCRRNIIKHDLAHQAYELTHLGLRGTCYEYLQFKKHFQYSLHESKQDAAATGAETEVDTLLKCKKCEISFKTKREMKAHERKHELAKRNDYKCEHCLTHLSSTRFVEVRRIKRTCGIYKQLFECAGEWQRHKTTSTCEKCNKILICRSEKLLHDTTNQNACVYCNTTLPCGSIVQQHESDSSIGPILSTIFNTPALKDVRCVYCAYCDFQKEGHTLLEACSYCKSCLPCAILQKGHEQINTCEHCAIYFACPKQKEDHICNESGDKKPKKLMS